VVIFNQPIGGARISASVASTAPLDGYTLHMRATSVFLAPAGGRWHI